MLGYGFIYLHYFQKQRVLNSGKPKEVKSVDVALRDQVLL
jgi:hypothetical protein